MTSRAPNLHVASRAENLLTALSWEEKLAQLQIAYRPNLADALELARSGIGAVFWPRTAEATNQLQRAAVEETPHGIPLLVGLDVIHGHRTIFPIPLAQAASFDPDIAESDARVSALEAASGGVNWTFAPMVDVTRDPRWGRVAEGFGEDTFLTAAFGDAKVRGYQGTSLGEPSSILACAKHYVGYGLGEGGRDYNAVDASEYRLRNVHLEPFRRAVASGVATVMASFNTVAGRPAHVNRWLLSEILKEEWEHEGFVVGDADGVPNLLDHGVAEDLADALAQAFGAGLDMEMGGNVVDETGRTALTPDVLDADRVDDAVRRVLRLKMELGLFEDPYVDPAAEVTTMTSASRTTTQRAAERCAVLLKNDGTLPLESRPMRLLLVGPYADSTDHLGAWVQSFGESAGSIADALRTERPDIALTVLPGASFGGDGPELQAEVVRAASTHDMIIVIVGEPSSLTGEASSRSDLRLPGDQEALIHAVAGSGTSFAVTLVNGRPLDLSGWIDRAPAVLETWHLGSQAPQAIARLLTGAANPGGRLPMSFPRSVGQIPIHYDHENTGRPASTGGTLLQDEIDIGLHGPANVDDRFTSKYRDLPLGPLFPFGHGLSYTAFEYGPASLSTTRLTHADLRRGATFELAVPVTNVGDRSGDEVVQLYVRDPVSSLAQPVRRLCGFQRIALDPQEARVVTLAAGWQELGFWAGRGDEFVVEPGRFELHVGGSLLSTQQSDVTVTGAAPE